MTLRLAWLVPALVACAPAIAAPRSDTTRLTIGGAEIEVVVEAGHLDAPRAELIAWVSTAASGVAAYFGRFPVARYRLVIEPRADRTGVLRGTTWAHGGARSRVFIGEHTRAEH